MSCEPVICLNLEETDLLASRLSKLIENTGASICLFGDIGAGKTAFAKCLCKHLEVKQKVTSPSFVILNEYKSGKLPVYHFDLYRLENEGIKTIINELEEYSQGKIVTLVEWAEFSQDALPFERIEIKIEYRGETKRSFTFKAFGETNKKVVEELLK